MSEEGDNAAEGAEKINRIYETSQKRITEFEEKFKAQKEEILSNIHIGKDRAQLTAASAMSMVHVVLLKELIVHYDEVDEYITRYRMYMALVAVTLLLQVTVGLIALYLGSVRKTFQNRDQPKDGKFQFFGVVFPWFCRRARRRRTVITSDRQPRKRIEMTPNEDESNELIYKVDMEVSAAEYSGTSSAAITSYQCTYKNMVPYFCELDLSNFHDDMSLAEDAGCRCCGCKMGNEFFMHNGYDLEDLYSAVESQRCLAQFQTQIAQNAVDKHIAEIKALTTELDNWQTDDDAEVKTKKQELCKKLKARLPEVERQPALHQNKVEEYEMQQRYLQDLQSLGMARYIESWQGILNLLLYVILILDAFITAFGLTDQLDLAGEQTTTAASDDVVTTITTLGTTSTFNGIIGGTTT